jgi:uncharacterized membrane protein YfcA
MKGLGPLCGFVICVIVAGVIVTIFADDVCAVWIPIFLALVFTYGLWRRSKSQ